MILSFSFFKFTKMLKQFSWHQEVMKCLRNTDFCFWFSSCQFKQESQLESNESAVLLVAVEPGVNGAVDGPRDGDDVARSRADDTGNEPGSSAKSVRSHVIVETLGPLVLAPLTNGPILGFVGP